MLTQVLAYLDQELVALGADAQKVGESVANAVASFLEANTKDKQVKEIAKNLREQFKVSD